MRCTVAFGALAVLTAFADRAAALGLVSSISAASIPFGKRDTASDVSSILTSTNTSVQALVDQIYAIVPAGSNASSPLRESGDADGAGFNDADLTAQLSPIFASIQSELKVRSDPCLLH